MRFEDEYSQVHIIKEKVSVGGEGIVYRTQDPNVLIKMRTITDQLTGEVSIVEGEQEYKKYKSDLIDVRIADLPDGVKIAKPVAFLKSPQCGYIMRTLDNMVPIQTLMFTNQHGDPLKAYLESGGVLRRLQIITKFAKMFVQLHSLPLVFADLSEGNLFISSSADATEAWLIDADNLQYEARFTKVVGTEGYRAPEIANGSSSNTTYSDVYSFAIIAYKILTYRPSPFIGELRNKPVGAVEDDSWDDEGWDDDPNDISKITDNNVLAELGELPWVDDLMDDSNRTKGGWPLEIVASKKMIQLFQQTFGYEGRKNPATRPTMEQWYEVLVRASKAMIHCTNPNCQTTFFITQPTCYICKTPISTYYLARMYDLFDINKMFEDEEDFEKLNYQDPQVMEIRKKQVGFLTIENNKKNQYLTNYELKQYFMSEPIENLIEIQIDSVVTIRNLSSSAFILIAGEEKKLLQPYAMQQVRELNNIKIVSYISSTKSRIIEFERRG